MVSDGFQISYLGVRGIERKQIRVAPFFAVRVYGKDFSYGGRPGSSKLRLEPGEGTAFKVPPSDFLLLTLLPSARFHLLKIPQTSK